MSKVSPPTLEEIEHALWHEADPKTRADVPKDTLFETYKLYLEMADRVSARRATANTFFLSVNSLILSVIGLFGEENPILAIWLLPIGLAGIILCLTWILILRSYRNLNSAKFKIVGLMERELPLSPWWKAEWKALGEGKTWRLYIPLSVVETSVPILFTASYLLIMLV
jgi:hypothetical protein